MTPSPSVILRGKLLVIDDEQLIRVSLERALGREHDVTTLADPREAMRRIEAGERYDLILCDLIMPAATGMDVHAQLCITVPDQAARMVFITGDPFTSGVERFFARVGNPRLDKPVELDALRRLLDERLYGTGPI